MPVVRGALMAVLSACAEQMKGTMVHRQFWAVACACLGVGTPVRLIFMPACVKPYGMQRRYTHVLKTDDDCYIRYPALAATLRQQPPDDSSPPKKPHVQIQMRAVYKGVCTSCYISEHRMCIPLHMWSCVRRPISDLLCHASSWLSPCLRRVSRHPNSLVSQNPGHALGYADALQITHWKMPCTEQTTIHGLLSYGASIEVDVLCARMS